MSTTITIRADAPLRTALDKRAAATGKTVSELVRGILEEALAERRVCDRAGHLRGRLTLSRKAADAFGRQLRQRNWRS